MSGADDLLKRKASRRTDELIMVTAVARPMIVNGRIILSVNVSRRHRKNLKPAGWEEESDSNGRKGRDDND
jgi:hypothetical protein